MSAEKPVVHNVGSIGGALAAGIPVIFTSKDSKPQVICREGREREALETMSKMGLIELVRPQVPA